MYSIGESSVYWISKGISFWYLGNKHFCLDYLYITRDYSSCKMHKNCGICKNFNSLQESRNNCEILKAIAILTNPTKNLRFSQLFCILQVITVSHHLLLRLTRGGPFCWWNEYLHFLQTQRFIIPPLALAIMQESEATSRIAVYSSRLQFGKQKSLWTSNAFLNHGLSRSLLACSLIIFTPPHLILNLHFNAVIITL
jgi:hypothetical protein